MKKRRPLPPRTQRRPSHSRTGPSTAAITSLSDYLPRLWKGCAIGVLLATAIALVAGAIGAAVLLSMPDPNRGLCGMSATILLLCTLACGVSVGRATGERTLLGGLTAGTLLLLLVLLLSYLPTQEQPLFGGVLVWVLRGAVLLFATLGVYLGSHAPTRRRRGR